MRHVRSMLIGGVCGVLLVASADARIGTESSSSEAPPDAQLRDCRTRAEGAAPIAMKVGRTDIQIGPLLLGNVRDPRGAGPTDDPDWPFWRKTPVLLPARAKVVLAIAPEAVGRAAFEHRGGWASAIRFTACFERVRAYAYRGTVGPTTFFPLGIGLRQRTACIPMNIWIDGRSSPIRRIVPLGRRNC